MDQHIQCGQDSVELVFPSPAVINAIVTREDLSKGQAVASYNLEYKDTDGAWTPIQVWLLAMSCMQCRPIGCSRLCQALYQVLC